MPRGRWSATPGADAPTYAAVRDAVDAQTRLLYRTSVELVQYPAQGDFAWWYQNANQVFNAATYDYVSARVEPGDAPGLVALSPSGGFPQAYAALLAGLTWTVADADRGSPGSAEQAARALVELDSLRAACANPVDGSGGMRTVDPVNGAISAASLPGYTVGSSLAALAASLQGGGPTIVAQVAGPRGSTVTLTYPSCTMVPVEPAAWQPATGTGWYAPDPVAQAFARGTGDPTGYAFVTPPAYRPGPVADGGDLGRIVSVLLSGPPTVAVQAGPEDDVSDLEDLRAEVMDALSLLALGGRAPLRPTALARSGAASVPLLQQRAYVVGLSVATPARPVDDVGGLPRGGGVRG